MNAREYQVCAERTMTDISNDLQMVNAALGLCGEAAELIQDRERGNAIVDELGDCAWYSAQLCRSLSWSVADFDVGERYCFDDAEIRLLRSAARVADIVKKIYFHKKPLRDVRGDLRSHTADVIYYLDQVAQKVNVRMSEVYAHNVQKLMRRFPDGFSHEAANARADEEHADA